MDVTDFSFLCCLFWSSSFSELYPDVDYICQNKSYDYFFTLGTSTDTGVQEEFSVYVTLEESAVPVAFNLTFSKEYSQFLKSPTLQLTLNPGEAQKVLIQVKDNDYF